MAEISEKHIDNKTLVAFDHMRVSMSQLEWAYAMVTIYGKMLSNDEETITEGGTEEETKDGQAKKQKGKK